MYLKTAIKCFGFLAFPVKRWWYPTANLDLPVDQLTIQTYHTSLVVAPRLLFLLAELYNIVPKINDENQSQRLQSICWYACFVFFISRIQSFFFSRHRHVLCMREMQYVTRAIWSRSGSVCLANEYRKVFAGKGRCSFVDAQEQAVWMTCVHSRYCCPTQCQYTLVSASA